MGGSGEIRGRRVVAKPFERARRIGQVGCPLSVEIGGEPDTMRPGRRIECCGRKRLVIHPEPAGDRVGDLGGV